MPTTSNFGWTTPADTDLVKDGAAAIRTLGNGVDSSFVDLKGGTSGQILSKNSNTDLDFVWIANDQGDITAVTAGTGISGGGTSGAVTITNSMATEITAKGDLIVGTGNAAFDNLAAGTNDGFLKADSSTSTGLVWDNSAYTTYTPVLSAATGTFTTASATGRYKRIGKTIILQQVITITTNGTAAGNVAATLPVNSQGGYTGIYRETSSTGNAGQVQTETDKAVYRTFTNGYPGNNAYTFTGTIVYEVA